MAAEFLPGNRLTLLNSGSDYFPALLAAIGGRKPRSISRAYIFADDEIGHEVASALCQAAERGVLVNVTVDGFGARNFAADFRPCSPRPASAPCTTGRRSGASTSSAIACAACTANWWSSTQNRLRRWHQHHQRRQRAARTAPALRLRGAHRGADPGAGPPRRPPHVGNRFLGQLQAPLPPRTRSAGPAATSPASSAAFLIRDNIRHRNDILNAYLDAIGRREQILIANAYFMPGVRFGGALYAAAQRGVRIIVLLQGKTDHQLLRYATQAVCRRPARRHPHLRVRKEYFMHAKVAVIDGTWATVGSSNIIAGGHGCPMNKPGHHPDGPHGCPVGDLLARTGAAMGQSACFRLLSAMRQTQAEHSGKDGAIPTEAESGQGTQNGAGTLRGYRHPRCATAKAPLLPRIQAAAGEQMWTPICRGR